MSLEMPAFLRFQVCRQRRTDIEHLAGLELAPEPGDKLFSQYIARNRRALPNRWQGRWGKCGTKRLQLPDETKNGWGDGFATQFGGNLIEGLCADLCVIDIDD